MYQRQLKTSTFNATIWIFLFLTHWTFVVSCSAVIVEFSSSKESSWTFWKLNKMVLDTLSLPHCYNSLFQELRLVKIATSNFVWNHYVYSHFGYSHCGGTQRTLTIGKNIVNICHPHTHIQHTTYNTKTHTIIHPYENTSTKLLILEEMVILLIVNLNIKCPKGSVIHVLSKFPFGSRKILIVSTFHSHFLQTFCSEISVWLDRQYCTLVIKLLTSHIDKYWPCQQLSAPFKARNSRQVQTCYISHEYNTKKLQHFNWFKLASGETWVLMTLNHRASEKQHLPLKRQHFHFDVVLSFGILSKLWYSAVITICE